VRQPLSFLNILETCKFNETIKNKWDNTKITLLLSPEVIKNEESVQLLKMQNQIELGTHMHLEFLKDSTHEVLETSEVQAEISPEEDMYYLARLTKLFIDQFGYQPLSFRAGRYGYNRRSTFITLKDLGYEVDSSIAPKCLFSFKKGIYINNSGYNLYPFFFSHGLVEVPISVMTYGNAALYRIVKKIPSYRIRKYFDFLKPKQRWIRPSYEDLDSLKENTSKLIKGWDVSRFGEPIINMMFHSNEFYPAASPYNKSWKDVEVFITKIIHYVEWLEENYEVKFSYLSDIEVKA
jgi:hypothetical protein